LLDDKSKTTKDNSESLLIIMSKFTKEYRKTSFKSIEGYGLTPSEIDVLMFLLNNAPLDTAKDICKYKGISKALVCRSVDSLSKRGLISTEVDDKDRRIIHLVLNDNAREIVDKLKVSKNIFINKILEGIKEEDMKIFMKAVNIMFDNISSFKEE
jgi:DNA-binding MarR family transcriptional regulator